MIRLLPHFVLIVRRTNERFFIMILLRQMHRIRFGKLTIGLVERLLFCCFCCRVAQKK